MKRLLVAGLLLVPVAASCSRAESYDVMLANPCEQALRVFVFSDNGAAIIGPASDQSFQPRLEPLSLTTTDRQVVEPEQLGEETFGLRISYGDGAGETFELDADDVVEMAEGPAFVGVVPAEACRLEEDQP